MKPHHISQISLSRRLDLIRILAVAVLAVGFCGCSEKPPVAKTGKVKGQLPGVADESLKQRKQSIPVPVADQQASSTAEKIETLKIDPQGEIANQGLNLDDSSQGSEKQAATSQDAKTSDASAARESIASGKTANIGGDSEQNSDPVLDKKAELSDSAEQDDHARPQFEVADEQTIEIPDTWKRLGQNEIWIDMKNKQVILAGYICINVGALEMFACPSGTKEHESIVAVNALASEMHAALLAIGAKPGAPCSWDDVSFTTASGSRINIDVRWRDEKTNEVITRPAKEMMKLEGEKELDIEWVFGGSRFLEDFETNFRSYSANSGEMICVSNFSTAAIDVNIDSTDANGSWLFWANTDKVPPRGTRVYLILSPGEYFNAQRQVFAEAEPQPIENEKENQKPATGESETIAPDSGLPAKEATQPPTSPATDEPSNKKDDRPSKCFTSHEGLMKAHSLQNQPQLNR